MAFARKTRSWCGLVVRNGIAWVNRLCGAPASSSAVELSEIYRPAAIGFT